MTILDTIDVFSQGLAIADDQVVQTILRYLKSLIQKQDKDAIPLRNLWGDGMIFGCTLYK